MKRLVNLGLGLVVAIGLAGVALAADGSQASVTGNLEDAYCYGSMGAKGPGHKHARSSAHRQEFPWC